MKNRTICCNRFLKKRRHLIAYFIVFLLFFNFFNPLNYHNVFTEFHAKTRHHLENVLDQPNTGIYNELDNSHLNASINANFVCQSPNLDFSKTDHVQRAYEDLKEIYEKCGYYENDYQNLISVKSILHQDQTEIFVVKINTTILLNLIGTRSLNDSNLDCDIQQFIKDTDKQEGHTGLNRIMIKDRFNLTESNEFKTFVIDYGFYELKCYNNLNESVLFKDVFNIFPDNMAKLIAKHKHHFEHIENLKQNMKKKDSITNPMLTDGNLFEKCELKDNFTETSRKMNVMMLYFDSVSNAQFKRIFPHTFDYLRSLTGNIILNNHFVVGENSLPNFVPLLTGVNILMNDELNISNEKSSFYDNIDDSYFDLYPFIWRDYYKLGYLTSYAEDNSFVGTFNYNLNGFRYQPSSIYFPTFWKTYEMMRTGPLLCHNKKPTFVTILENIRNFIQKMNSNEKNKNLNYFLFNLMNYYTHNVDALPVGFDMAFKKLLEEFETKGYLQNTLLIIGGDHGARFNDYSLTELGWEERRLPYTSVRLPKILWNTEYHKNFFINSERLTTNYDLHKTLKHFYYWNKFGVDKIDHDCIELFKNPNQKVRALRGISLFEEINSNRTCSEANVPLSICACKKVYQMNEDQFKKETNFDYITAANHLLHEIISKTDEIRPSCEIFKLIANSEAFKMIIDGKIFYSLRVLLQPGDAVFEGSLKLSKNKDFLKVSMIERISRYGDQSHCVSGKKFEGFCYCIQSKENHVI